MTSAYLKGRSHSTACQEGDYMALLCVLRKGELNFFMSARVLSLISPQNVTVTENERLLVAANRCQCERPFFSSQ